MVHRPTTRAEVSAVCEPLRAIAFISVDWSIYERHGRQVFAELIQRLEEQHPDLGVSFWILHEDWEGMADWFAVSKPPIQVSTGYGAVVWLEKGSVVAAEEYAARVGVAGLLSQTLRLWGKA
jgi:hypothetical protein